MTCLVLSCRLISRSLKAIRNVGIIAHIDAGKTTTTERMLFNSGKIKTLGEVDKGTTTTDYLDQERERGISITSSIATMKWKEHDINLIDTPGHVDFTLEVERSLAILDGAVTVLDAVKGVEAQTQTVWNQARNHQIPNIFFINKFDKINANLNFCLKSIKHKLSNISPLCLHLPYNCPVTGDFVGIIDIVDLQLEYWNLKNKSSKDISTESYTRKISDTEEIFETCILAREKLLESLADLEDGIIREEFLVLDNPAILIPSKMIHDALRKVTISARASPVLIGSSKINIGVTNILNKIVSYLPDPTEKNLCSKFANLAAYPDHVTALAFKVIHDKYRGPLTFLRIYSGILKPDQVLHNHTRFDKEKVEKLIQITGDHFTELDSSSAGNIVAVSGLKNCYTGDLLIDNKFTHCADDDAYSDLISIPTPVIYASIEASALSKIRDLEKALFELSKEDPSLKYHKNEETHQLIIGGMGKLHLEIVLDRIINDYKLTNTRLGKVRIAYKEYPKLENNLEVFHSHEISEKIHGICVKLSIRLSATSHKDFNTKSNIEFVNSQEFKWSSVDLQIIKILKEHITKAIDTGGSLLHSPVTGLKINVFNFSMEPKIQSILSKSNQPFLRSFATESARELLKNIHTNLLEPMMKVEISFNNSDFSRQYTSKVMSDMYKRRSQIVSRENINSGWISDSITAFVPLSETGDYADVLRSLTSGNASMHMSFSHYDVMSQTGQDNVTKKIMYRSRN